MDQQVRYQHTEDPRPLWQHADDLSEPADVEEKKGRPRPGVRTFLVPLLFMALHHLVLNGASAIRLLYFLSRNPEYRDLLLNEPTANKALIEVLVQGNVMTYASLIGMLVLVPAYLLYLFFQKRRGRSLLGKDPLSARNLFSSLAVILGALGLTQVWMLVLASLDPSSLIGKSFQDYLDKMTLFDGRTADLPLELLVTVFLVPVGEELLFRGIIQGELGRVFSPSVTVLATSFLFALFHLDLIQGSYVLIAGLALSVCYQLTRNLLVPIFMHMLFNLIGSGWFTRLLGGGERVEIATVIALYAFILVGALALFFQVRGRSAHKGEAGL